MFKITWPKASTVQNTNIIVPLFKDNNADNKVFLYPDISQIKISIEGKLN